jgi:hypothetical protein
VGIDEFDEFIEDGFLDEALLVDGGRKFFEVYGGSNRFPELSNESHVDVGFEEGGANLLEHGIKGLRG